MPNGSNPGQNTIPRLPDLPVPPSLGEPQPIPSEPLPVPDPEPRSTLVEAGTSTEAPVLVETAVQTEGIRIRRDRRERNRDNGTTFNKNPFGDS